MNLYVKAYSSCSLFIPNGTRHLSRFMPFMSESDLWDTGLFFMLFNLLKFDL
jgi:hypothetical protein